MAWRESPEDVLPPGYKMTELGPLPEEWQVVRLGEVGEVTAGGSAPQGQHYFGGRNPFIRVQHLDEDGFWVRRWDLITDEAVETCRLRLFPKGTIVFPKSGASIRLEKRAMLPVDAYIVSHLCAVIPNGQAVDQKYLFYALKFRKFSSEKAEGYPTLNLSEIRDALIPLPPLPEQRAIAGVLSAIQRAIEVTDRVIAAARQLKRSLMRHLFTYGPVPPDQAEQVPLKETEIGPVPAHWEVVRLGELFAKGVLLMRNGFPQGEHNLSGQGVPHLRPFNVTTDGCIDLEQIKYVQQPSDDSPYWLQRGDIIFNNTNSEDLVGKTAYLAMDGRYVLSNHMTFIRILKPDTVDAYWLSKYLHYLWMQDVFRGLCRRHVNQASVSLERLKAVEIPLPPPAEQQEIARILQSVDRKIEAEERRKSALQALFRTMLHLLMTGQIRVKDMEF